MLQHQSCSQVRYNCSSEGTETHSSGVTLKFNKSAVRCSVRLHVGTVSRQTLFNAHPVPAGDFHCSCFYARRHIINTIILIISRGSTAETAPLISLSTALCRDGLKSGCYSEMDAPRVCSVPYLELSRLWRSVGAWVCSPLLSKMESLVPVGIWTWSGWTRKIMTKY